MRNHKSKRNIAGYFYNSAEQLTYFCEIRYTPARTNWSRPQLGSEPSSNTNPSNPGNLSPIKASPVELQSPTQFPGHARNRSSEVYVEDVDPRFAEPTVPLPNLPPQANAPPPAIPSALVPGPRGMSPLQQQQMTRQTPSPMGQQQLPPQSQQPLQQQMPPSRSQETLPPHTSISESRYSIDDIAPDGGPRSPAASEASNFTSVSQRGINPRWPGYNNNGAPPPPPGMIMGAGGPPPRRRQEDVLLAANPDFAIPGTGPGKGIGRLPPGIGGPNGRYPTGR